MVVTFDLGPSSMFAQTVDENCIHVIAAVHSCRGSKHVCLCLDETIGYYWELLGETDGGFAVPKDCLEIGRAHV